MTKLPPDDLTADLAILIAAAWRAVTDELQASVVAAEPAMRPAFGFVIRAVDSESPTINRLAELLGTTKQAASLLADEVEAAGFIERFTPPDDRRRRRLRLTGRGAAVRARAVATSARLEAELASMVGEEAVLGCRETLMTLVARTGGLDDVLARRARPVW
jgi:DNA-binding MarR family transcriptional regulator